ncbi:SMP-30/gluconolactonase/LRE family protein [Nonomuraea wenchangensis]
MAGARTPLSASAVPERLRGVRRGGGPQRGQVRQPPPGRGRRLWAAAMGDGVHCYDPDGTLIGRIAVPEPVADISWGGAKRNRLFITATTSVYSLLMGVTGTHPTGPGRRPWL